MKKKSEVGRDKRKIETLEKQVDAAKDRLDKITIEISTQEQKHHSLKREVGTLTTQVDAALYTNAKLNVLIPGQIRLAIEEEVAAKFEKPKEDSESKPIASTKTAEYTSSNVLFDTSVKPEDIEAGTEELH